jgi:hypothetical protein
MDDAVIGSTGTAIDRVDRAVVSSGEHRVVARAAVQAIRPAACVNRSSG